MEYKPDEANKLERKFEKNFYYGLSYLFAVVIIFLAGVIAKMSRDNDVRDMRREARCDSLLANERSRTDRILQNVHEVLIRENDSNAAIMKRHVEYILTHKKN